MDRWGEDNDSRDGFVIGMWICCSLVVAMVFGALIVSDPTRGDVLGGDTDVAFGVERDQP